MRTAIARLPVLTAIAAALGGCGSGKDDEGARLVVSDPIGHVHAVGFDRGARAILIATHNGLLRADSGDVRASPVGDERRDVMGFGVEGPGSYVGSGHPDPRRGGPPSVGFIRSTDGGRSWDAVSLEGEADLHAIDVAGRRVYGFDAVSGALLRSTDAGRTWRATRTPPVLDLAVDPRNAERLVLSTEMGILASDDGGATLRPVVKLPLSHLTWDSGGVTAIGGDQVVRRLGDDLRTVSQAGRAPVVPAALTAADGDLLVAADDGAVHRSRDGGRTWIQALRPVAADR